MKLSKTGCRITKNGNPILGIEKGAIKSVTYEGQSIKVEGSYYFFSRKQNGIYIYLNE